jgi:hypothetical protein
VIEHLNGAERLNGFNDPETMCDRGYGAVIAGTFLL